MQKTVLAMALASVFSVGTAYAATELMGESTSALLHSKEAKGDYVLSGDFTLDVTGDIAVDYAKIDLNGHKLILSSSSTSATCWGVVNQSEIFGKGTVIIKQTGKNPGVGYMNTTSIAADDIQITSDNYYGVFAEDKSNHTYDANSAETGKISVTSTNKNAVYVSGDSSATFKNFATLTITSNKETKSGYAINNNGGTLSINGGTVDLTSTGQTALCSMSSNATTTIVAKTVTVKSLDVDIAANDEDASRKADAIVAKAGTLNITTDDFTSTVEAAKDCLNCAPVHALAVKDSGVLNIKAGTSTINGDVQATGGELGLTSDSLTVNGNVEIAEAAKAPLTFNGAGSSLNGAANVAGANNSLAFNDGATWTVKGESTVSNLRLDNAKVDMSGTDKNVTANNLTGTAGNVVMDAKGTNTFTVTNETTTKVTAVASQDADSVNVEEVKKMVDRIVGQVADKSAAVNEGAYNGAISVDNQGNVTITTNSLMEDTLTLGGSSLLSLNRILMNDVRKRMGDVRAMEGTTGAWARYDGGRLSATGLQNDFNTIQVGADTLVPNTNWRVGLAASYTKGDNDFRRGSADLDAYMLTGYGLWMADNGMFADVVARLAKAENDMTVDGGAKAGKLDNRAYSLSGEFGWRFDLSNQYYVEPQAELTYTYVDSEDLDLGSAQYKFDTMTSLLGRVGVATGIKCPNNKGDLYFRVSAVHEFDGDAKITGANGTSLTQDGKDTWVEYGIGGNFNLTPTTYFWADLERTAGATLETDWRATFGVRHAF